MRDSSTALVPATSANLGPGFDSLGLALSVHDTVTATRVDSGVRVEIDGPADGLPRDESHLIAATIMTASERLGHPLRDFELHCVNRIPHARGMGSSSAAISAGVLLADSLLETKMTNGEKVALASEIEGHPDNVAPCLLGGFTIAYLGETGARAVSRRVHERVRPVVFVPQMQGLTETARAALPATVPYTDAVFNLSRSALLVEALTSEPDLLWEATADRIHQPYRANGMPDAWELVRRLREQGFAAAISGAGPSVIVLCDRESESPGECEDWERLELDVGPGACVLDESPGKS
ncbi:homoserine kinase [Haloglycomyces albus]|uniref:homoserine kinase n=1 Tax=Haloglycomyces albus TaxID=526067 RepID=UPI00046C9A99|nr:homoserine kinase [Haloglycomyces albus]